VANCECAAPAEGAGQANRDGGGEQALRVEASGNLLTLGFIGQGLANA
jgi:hypothetical protein